MSKLMTFFFFFCFLTFYGQKSKEIRTYMFDTKYSNVYNSRAEIYLDRSKNIDSYHFMQISYILDGISSIISVDKDEQSFDLGFKLIENIINNSITVYIENDEYKGWYSSYGLDKKQEVVLYEGYLLESALRFIYTVEKYYPDYDEDKCKNIVVFLEKNIWQKWEKKSQIAYKNNFTYFMKTRVHTSAHWGTSSLFLEYFTKKELYKKFNKDFYLAIKNNLKLTKKENYQYYIWNSTWNSNLDFAKIRKSNYKYVQDTSHGNSVVNYMITSNYFKFGTYYDDDDIGFLVNTLKYVIYDKAQGSFAYYVDGDSDGNKDVFLAAGWVKLKEKDSNLKSIFENYLKSKLVLEDKKYQYFQYYSNLYYKIF